MATKRLGRGVAVVGAGMSKFGTFPGKATRDLFVELERFSACVVVLLDLDPQRVEFVRALQQAQVGVLVLLVSARTRREFADALGSLPSPHQVQVVDPQQAERALAALSSPGAANG